MTSYEYYCPDCGACIIVKIESMVVNGDVQCADTLAILCPICGEYTVEPSVIS